MAIKKKKQNLIEKIYMKLNMPSSAEKANFFRLLAVTQNAGLGIKDSLESIGNSETHPGMKKIIEDALNLINEGYSLSEALGYHNNFFTNTEISIIHSAETTGKLPETLNSLAQDLEKFELIKKKLKSAMMYPVIVIIISIVAVIILLWKVIPSIIKIFPPGLELPAITQMVVAASNYLQSNYVFIFSILISVPSIFAWSYQNFISLKIVVDKFLLKAPVIGNLLRNFYRYRLCKLWADFYDAGIPTKQIFEQLQEVFSNYHFKKKFEQVVEDLNLGLSITQSLEGSWIINPILIQIIGIGEQTGNIGSVLQTMGNFYREELDGKLEGLSKVIEPLLMVFVAGIIGTIVASIFLPMATLIGSLAS